VLRLALMVRGVSEDVPLLLTLFDSTMAEQVAEVVANTQVTSLADIVAPSLAGPSIDERFTAVTFEDGKPVGLIERDGEVSKAAIKLPRPRRVEALARALFTPYDKSAGMLLFGAIGLAAVFALETVTAVFTLDESVVDAIYGSAKTLVTVDPNPGVAKGPDWYKLFTSVSMVVALLLAAAGPAVEVGVARAGHFAYARPDSEVLPWLAGLYVHGAPLALAVSSRRSGSGAARR